MTKDEVEYIRDTYSAMYKAKPEASPWKKSFLGMAIKTVTKALLRSLSISNELDNALGADDFFETAFLDDSKGPKTSEDATEKLKEEKKPVKAEDQGSLL
jgi:recombinational DNA repair protein RecT